MWKKENMCDIFIKTTALNSMMKSDISSVDLKSILAM
jgi:hypothetical protein